MRLRDVRPGVSFDPRPLSRITPGTALQPLTVTAPAMLVQGVAFVPVPGRQGGAGEPGLSAYEVWLDQGNTGTVADFLESQRGPPGSGLTPDERAELDAKAGLGDVQQILTATLALVSAAVSTQRITERFTVTSAGELTVSLSHIPLPDTLEVYINGFRQFDIDDLPRAGTAVTFPDTWFLIPGERLALVYAY